MSGNHEDKIKKAISFYNSLWTSILIDIFYCRIYIRKSKNHCKVFSSFSPRMYIWMDGKEWQLSNLWQGIHYAFGWNCFFISSFFFSFSFVVHATVSLDGGFGQLVGWGGMVGGGVGCSLPTRQITWRWMMPLCPMRWVRVRYWYNLIDVALRRKSKGEQE